MSDYWKAKFDRKGNLIKIEPKDPPIHHAGYPVPGLQCEGWIEELHQACPETEGVHNILGRAYCKACWIELKRSIRG